MTVIELINKLYDMPQDLEVIDQDNDFIETIEVVQCGDTELVRLC